ncbi:MAG TPA: hypothetical protein VFB80_00345, partial [Pirellulaceae bacterium]|nr:hypothetical protein [Pirellulaceae bacterium]
LLKMQLQVGSVWLAVDATGKRIEPPAPAEPAAAAESGDAAGGAAPPEEAAPPADAAAPAAPAVPAKFVFVELRVTNGDTVPHSYASWNSLAGTSAILADGNGQPLEFVPPAATPGVTRHNLVELAPGQTVTDVLVFAAPQGPPGKLKLALANTALLGNVKSSGSTHLGLEIPPDYLLNPPETTVGIEAGAAPAPPAAAAPAAEGDAPPPLANAPPAKPRDPSAPPTLDDFTKDLERQELMKKKEGQGGEFEDLKVPPTAPKKPLPGKAGEKAP